MPRSLFPLLLPLLLLLGGCSGHNLALVEREQGTIITGSLPGSLEITGEMELKLEEETYKGNWIVVRGGEFPLLKRFGKEMLFDSGAPAAQGPVRYGKIYLRSEEGGSLRCEFKYYEAGETGTGICMDKEKRIYDLLLGKE